MRLQYIQEQSRQTILPGLELFYEHPPFLTVGIHIGVTYF